MTDDVETLRMLAKLAFLAPLVRIALDMIENEGDYDRRFQARVCERELLSAERKVARSRRLKTADCPPLRSLVLEHGHCAEELEHAQEMLAIIRRRDARAGE